MRDSLNAAVLLDTNVLVYAEQRKEPQHEEAKSLRDRALRGEIAACVSPQVLAEFYSVITNTGPRGPENPLTAQEATDRLRRYYESDSLAVIYSGPGTVTQLLALLASHPATGPGIFDVVLAATMLENGVAAIATYDQHTFPRLPGITVLTPGEVLRLAESEASGSSGETSPTQGSSTS